MTSQVDKIHYLEKTIEDLKNSIDKNMEMISNVEKEISNLNAIVQGVNKNNGIIGDFNEHKGAIQERMKKHGKDIDNLWKGIRGLDKKLWIILAFAIGAGIFEGLKLLKTYGL